MQIELFKVFNDLAETASFSQAARLNSITQSAVSQQVKALEARFAARLIDRGKKSFSLTPEGLVFLTAAKEMLAVVGSLDDRLREMREVATGDVKISAILSVALHELPPKTKLFNRLHPQVKFHISYRRSSEIYASVLDGSSDVGFVAYPLARRGLEAEVLWQDRLVLVCSPTHPLARRNRLPLSALDGQEFIAFAADLPTRKMVDRTLRDAGVVVRRVMEFDNIETLKRTVEIGDAISIVPEAVLGNERRAGSLIPVQLISEDMWRPIGVVTRKNRPGSLAHRKFIEAIRDGNLGGGLAKRKKTAD